MKKLNFLKNQKKLRLLTEQSSITYNETLWIGKYSMVDRFFKLKKFIGVNDNELSKSMLTAEKIIHIGKLEETMKTFALVNTALQGSLTLYEFRCLFDALISKILTLNYYLSDSAKILHNASFESGIVKLQSDRVDILTAGKKKRVKNA
ncbi:hypothetical protein CDIK_1279 [Cucumispora dikerogammari]|nr:hypothetical protein CDIK_1279 [Cucumispora dikerogammari]